MKVRRFTESKILTNSLGRKIEGYWYGKYCPEYPKPIPNVLNDEQAKEIYDLILIKERDAFLRRFKGWSTSRITGEKLGSTEHQTDEWTWPCDFAKHYVLDHKVKPTDEFLEYIGY